MIIKKSNKECNIVDEDEDCAAINIIKGIKKGLNSNGFTIAGNLAFINNFFLFWGGVNLTLLHISRRTYLKSI